MPSEGEGVYFVGAVHSVVSPKGDAHLEPFKPPEVSFHQPAIVPTASVPCWLRGIHRSLMGNPSPRREVKGSLR